MSPLFVRTLATAARFALTTYTPDAAHLERRRHAQRTALLLHATLHPGQIALITGPSGSGKSTLLRALLPLTTCLLPQPVDDHPAPVAERSELPLNGWLNLLARLGLSDAHLLLQPPNTLSAGQQARYALALAIAESLVRPPHHRLTHTLVVDEFLAHLDRPAAKSTAYALARFIRKQPHLRLVVATTHTDLAVALNPDKHIELNAEPPANQTFK